MGLWAGHVTRVNFHTYQFILDTVFLPLPRSQCSNIYTQSNMVVHSFLMANQFNSVNCSKHRCRTKTIDRSYVATPNKKERVGENHYYQCTHLSLDGCRVFVSISPIERRSTCWTQSVSLAPNTWIFNPNYRQPLTGKSFSITCTPRHPSISSCHRIWLWWHARVHSQTIPGRSTVKRRHDNNKNMVFRFMSARWSSWHGRYGRREDL